MNKILLYLIMLPKGLWKSLGADVIQLKAILAVKLKMDDRKPMNPARPQNNKKRQTKYKSTLAFVLNFFLGAMYIFPMVGFKDPFMGLFVFYTMLIVLLTFGLISDFSSVLIDTRDKLIIFPKPVNDRTFEDCQSGTF
jgi:ABC-2 type transport system permease protein